MKHRDTPAPLSLNRFVLREAGFALVRIWHVWAVWAVAFILGMLLGLAVS